MSIAPAFSARIDASETVATDTGEAVMPICADVDATAMGRSGRMPFFTAMSSMMGNMV